MAALAAAAILLLTLLVGAAAFPVGMLKGIAERRLDSTKPMPIFSTELRVEGARLETLVGQPEMIQGPVQGFVRITGRGTTIREAFSNGSGKIAFTATPVLAMMSPTCPSLNVVTAY